MLPSMKIQNGTQIQDGRHVFIIEKSYQQIMFHLSLFEKSLLLYQSRLMMFFKKKKKNSMCHCLLQFSSLYVEK
jgi:hypothetical protein